MSERLDDIDLQLLDLLQRNGRITNIDLAEHVGLSPSACLRRVQQLESSGLIQGYHAVLDTERLGINLQAIVKLTLRNNETKHLDAFDASVAEWPQVAACYRVTGDADYILHVITRDLASYRQFMMEELLQQPVVLNVSSSIVLDAKKQSRILPLHD